MKPTILLTGKTGQVGSELHRVLLRLGDVVAPDRKELDLLDPAEIRRTVRDLRPRLVVNAAAYTAVDAAEKDAVSAHAINAEAVKVLAEEVKRLNATFVHYSTDYVFDGSKRTPYDERDPANPLNVYGKSKLAGEQAVRDSGVPHLIFRTAWVYSTRGRNFLLTILRLATEREELRIVSDQIGAPTCALDIAVATAKVLGGLYKPMNGAFVFSKVTGAYHLTAAGQTTWFDFTKAILEEGRGASRDLPWLVAATQGRPLIARQVIPISTQEFRSPTHRPPYSVLSNAHLTDTFGIAPADWHAQLQRCFSPERVAPNLVTH
jgi:dTDP-4-dehydrorhamnose reductase